MVFQKDLFFWKNEAPFYVTFNIILKVSFKFIKALERYEDFLLQPFGSFNISLLQKTDDFIFNLTWIGCLKIVKIYTNVG